MERVGSDRVLVRDSRVIVLSRADMPGWEVREFRRATIQFRGERYHVRAKERRDGGFRYVLEKFPEDSTELGGEVLDYDECFVRERDAAGVARAVAARVHVLLVAFYPLLGLLPSAVKRRLADRYGIAEEQATVMSLWLELLALFASGALFTISSMAGIYGGGLGVRGIPWLEDLGTLALASCSLIGPDLVVRYSRLLAEDERCYGFWEWLFRWRRA